MGWISEENRASFFMTHYPILRIEGGDGGGGGGGGACLLQAYINGGVRKALISLKMERLWH